MSHQLIKSGQPRNSKLQNVCNYLKVSEFFSDTLQGEGIHAGHPATFLRLSGCTLNCVWCDSIDIWKYGNRYTFDELFYLMQSIDLIGRLKEGQHLVFTGGSPLLQQKQLVRFIKLFIDRYDFKPFIEVENECIIEPSSDLIIYVDTWNNSPKLSSSGKLECRCDIIKIMSVLSDSWFKFAISDDRDWQEIEEVFLKPALISKNKVILMPIGKTKSQLLQPNLIVSDICIKNNVKFSMRQHIELYDDMIGV